MAKHVFICYARQDQSFVLKLATALKEKGVPVWLDQWDIPTGVDWDAAIDQAIETCAQFLIVLSPRAVKSREVRGELRLALDEDKPIVPVLYQSCSVPRQLRLIQHIDFSEREPDDAARLGQVLKVLGGSEAQTARPAEKKPGQVAPSKPERADIVSSTPPKPQTVGSDRLPFEPEMILIPAGEFLMGSDPKKDWDTKGDEQPQHTLYLPDYYLAKTPVTNEQYAAFVNKTNHKPSQYWKDGRPPSGQGNHPVVNVSWYDALAYCRWLAEVTGQAYTLPSEAEWEKGARGTDGRIYPWGNRWTATNCNSEEGGKGATTPVDAYPAGASPYGLLDMAGNVWEWTRSLWGESWQLPDFEYPYDRADGREDLEVSGYRVLRGGAFGREMHDMRCAARYWYLPYNRYWNGGFRVVCPPK